MIYLFFLMFELSHIIVYTRTVVYLPTFIYTYYDSALICDDYGYFLGLKCL